MDGIVGGILGGLVTGGTVWLTLRNERRIREEDRRVLERAEVAAAVGRLRFEITGHRFEVPRTQNPLELIIWLRKIQEAIAVAMVVLTEDRTGGLHNDLRKALDLLDSCVAPKLKSIDRSRIMQITLAVSRGIHAWQVDAETYHGRIGHLLEEIEPRAEDPPN